MFGTNEPPLHALGPELTHLASSLVKAVSPERLRKDVEELIGPHNRLHSPKEMNKVEDLIFYRLQESGWEVKRRPFSLKQAKGNLDYGQFSPTAYPELSGVNLTAERKGIEPDDTLLIEAHYDTVRVSPGADDNTASVAAMLELARIIQPYALKKSVMLAACDMEEVGLIGATQLTRELRRERKISGAIVLETLAYFSKKPNSQSVPPGFDSIYPEQAERLKKRGFIGDSAVVIYHNNGKAQAIGFAESLKHLGGENSVILLRGPVDIPVLGWFLRFADLPLVRNFYRADHYPFLRAGVAAIQITDSANFRNPNYHRVTDVPNTLDYEFLAKIVVATALTVLSPNEG